MFGLALLELGRRFIWNFFRVENEYVNDCMQFHAIREAWLETPKLNTETYAMDRAQHTERERHELLSMQEN